MASIDLGRAVVKSGIQAVCSDTMQIPEGEENRDRVRILSTLLNSWCTCGIVETSWPIPGPWDVDVADGKFEPAGRGHDPNIPRTEGPYRRRVRCGKIEDALLRHASCPMPSFMPVVAYLAWPGGSG